MKLNICFYASERGDEPVKNYLDQISESDAAGIVACMCELQKVGFLLPPLGKKMSGQKGLYEIKCKKHRILYIPLKATMPICSLLLESNATKHQKMSLN